MTTQTRILNFINQFERETGTAPNGAQIADAVPAADVAEVLHTLTADEFLTRCPLNNVYAIQYSGLYLLDLQGVTPLPELQLIDDLIAQHEADNHSAYIRSVSSNPHMGSWDYDA